LLTSLKKISEINQNMYKLTSTSMLIKKKYYLAMNFLVYLLFSKVFLLKNILKKYYLKKNYCWDEHIKII